MTRNDNVFYGELASWWPLISPVEDYRAEAHGFLALLGEQTPGTPRRTLLELGSGGGHNASYFSPHFEMTLVDLSESMLEVSRQLNPTLEHVLGDMRTVRIGREFDVVFIHDAIDYMTTEDDLHRALTTAFVHLKPGGTAVFVPDETQEIFEPGDDTGGSDGDDGRSVRFLEWTVDPDPTDTVVTTEYVFLLRDADGSTKVAHETHQLGLFPRATWVRILSDVGFQAERLTEATDEDRVPRDIFIGTRPENASSSE
jgi:SAM-dependent methyltransferase